MEIIIIVAMARNRTIGRNNRLPWHIPEELKLFKKTTMGYPMIMGRKTFESLPGLLPGRRHIVLSRDTSYAPKGGEAATSISQALKMCSSTEKVFIIGGAEVFKESLAETTTILLTLLERDVDGDVFFPAFAEEEFQEISRKRYPEGKEPYTVITYKRPQEPPLL